MRFLARLIADYRRARAVRKARAELEDAERWLATCRQVEREKTEQKNRALVKLAETEPVDTVARRCGAL